MSYDTMLRIAELISINEDRHDAVMAEASNSKWMDGLHDYKCRDCGGMKMYSQMWHKANMNRAIKTGKLCLKCYFLRLAKKSIGQAIQNEISAAHAHEMTASQYNYSYVELPQIMNEKYDVESIITDDVVKLKASLLELKHKLKNYDPCNRSTQNQCFPCSPYKWIGLTEARLT